MSSLLCCNSFLLGFFSGFPLAAGAHECAVDVSYSHASSYGLMTDCKILTDCPFNALTECLSFPLLNVLPGVSLVLPRSFIFTKLEIVTRLFILLLN